MTVDGPSKYVDAHVVSSPSSAEMDVEVHICCTWKFACDRV